MRLVLVPLLILVLVALAGTAAAIALRSRRPDPGSEPVALDRILTAELVLPRLVRQPHEVAVLVHNRGTEAILIRQVELVTDSFTPAGPVDKEVTIAAGGSKSLAVTYGEAICTGEPAPPLSTTTAVLVVETADGVQAVELTLVNGDAAGLTTRLHADCAAQVVSAAADLRLQGWEAAPDGSLRTTLVVQRRSGDEPITLHVVTGSVLYRLTPPRQSPVDVLASGQDRLEVPIRADAARCDGHAMADAKAPFLFRISVTIGDSPLLPATIATDLTGQELLPDMWHALCGI